MNENYEPPPVHVRQIVDVLDSSSLLTTHLSQHTKLFIARLFLYAIADGTLAEAARYALGQDHNPPRGES